MKTNYFLKGISCLLLSAALTACSNAGKESSTANGITEKTRIVSLNGTLTEIVAGLGLEKNIVGVDVTSTYPASIAAIPKVGHNRNMAPEAIIALKPDIVIGVEEYLKPALVQQLKAAHAHVIVFHPQHSVVGAKELIQSVADSLHYTGSITALQNKIDADKAQAVTLPSKPKVLFIYARGAGTLMVAGTHTPVDNIITLAGGQNVITEFEQFKPLTSEAVVAGNPDVILLFDSGLASLGGVEGLLKIPGVLQTNAGKNKKVIEMDGQLLTGFGPRTGLAIAELSKKLNDAVKP